jgi:hypothetical protein
VIKAGMLGEKVLRRHLKDMIDSSFDFLKSDEVAWLKVRISEQFYKILSHFKTFESRRACFYIDKSIIRQ